MTRKRAKRRSDTLIAYQHEQFVLALYKRLTALEPLKEATTAAYRETILQPGSKDDVAIVEANARRLRNKAQCKALLEELLERTRKVASLDAGWALVQLKSRVEGSTVGNYLTPRVPGEPRRFDIDRCSDAQLAQLAELQIDEKELEVRGKGKKERHLIERKIKVKLVDPIGGVALMARIGGWEAPKKIAPTDGDGNDLNLLELVNASYELAAKRAAEAKAKEIAA